MASTVDVPELRENLVRLSQFIRVVMRCIGHGRDHPEISQKALFLLYDILDLLFRIKDLLNFGEEKWILQPSRVSSLDELLVLLESTLKMIETYLHPGGVGVRAFRQYVLDRLIVPKLEQYKTILILATQPDSEYVSFLI